MELLDIRPRRPELKARALSGGNQQKVILAKWLARRVGVLLLEEPTQGIDVAAKAQIHALIRDFVARGGGVLVNSSDLAELARLCDCVLAVRQGRIAAALDRAEGLDEPKLRAAIGGMSMARRGYRSNLAGQMPLISLIVLCAVTALLTDRFLSPLNLTNILVQSSIMAVIAHGHDLRDRGRRLRSLGRLDRRAVGLRRQHGDAGGRHRRRRGRGHRRRRAGRARQRRSSSPGSTSIRSSPRSAPWCWCAASSSSSPAARR